MTKLTAERLDELAADVRAKLNAATGLSGNVLVSGSDVLSLIAVARASLESRGEQSVYDMSDADYERLEERALLAWRISYVKFAEEADRDDADPECLTTNHLCPGDARECYTDGYLTGYLRALESSVPSAAGAESMAGWVKVSERLPERGDVLVLAASGYQEVRHLDHKRMAWYPGGLPVASTTHWMPLPSPPKVTP